MRTTQNSHTEQPRSINYGRDCDRDCGSTSGRTGWNLSKQFFCFSSTFKKYHEPLMHSETKKTSLNKKKTTIIKSNGIKNNPIKSNLIKNHAGIALPLVLIFFVVMTLIGVTAIRNATSGEKIAGNVRNQQMAFQAAEQALRFCENDLQKSIKAGLKSKYEGLKFLPIPSKPEGVNKAPTCRLTNISDNLALGPTEVSRDNNVFVYQITSIGTGPSDVAVAKLQSSLRFKK